MKLFVTGGTGFVGSHFLSTALAAGHEVVALRRSSGSQPRAAVPAGKIEWIESPLAGIPAEKFSGCEVVVHLAAGGVTPQPASWLDCCRVNIIDSLTMLRGALDAGVPRIVVSGTYAEYGRAGLRFDPIPPSAPLEPTDPYAASKASAGIALAAMCREQKFELIYSRLFSVFGEGQYEQNFWPQLRRAALAGEDFSMTAGDQIRDFVPIQSVARALLFSCTRADLVPGEPLIENLASGQPCSLRDFAETWWAAFGATGRLRVGALPSRPNEVKRYIPLVAGPAS